MTRPNEMTDVQEMIELETSGENLHDDTLIIEQEPDEQIEYPFLSLTKVEETTLETCYRDLLDKCRQLRIEVDVIEAQICIVKDELTSRPGYEFYG